MRRPRIDETALMIVRAIYKDAYDRGMLDDIGDETQAGIVQSWYDATLKELLSPMHDGFPGSMSLLEKVRQ
jgi:hypothetical protein